MRVLRWVVGALGVACGLWGLWHMRDFTRPQLTSAGWWLAAGVVLHDAVIAPLVVVVGFLAARWLPRHFRAVTAIGFLIWGTLTIVFVPVLSGQGGKPDNDTILGRPYWLSWFAMTAVIAALAWCVGGRRSRGMKTLHGSRT